MAIMITEHPFTKLKNVQSITGKIQNELRKTETGTITITYHSRMPSNTNPRLRKTQGWQGQLRHNRFITYKIRFYKLPIRDPILDHPIRPNNNRFIRPS